MNCRPFVTCIGARSLSYQHLYHHLNFFYFLCFFWHDTDRYLRILSGLSGEVERAVNKYTYVVYVVLGLHSMADTGVGASSEYSIA